MKLLLIFKYVLTGVLFFSSTLVVAERIRLDREHGVVNQALQEMLADQVSSFSGGVGKIELGRTASSKSDCMVDMFVSLDTVYITFDSKKTRLYTEFYVDHPNDSFKDVLFQALIKQGDERILSVDKKTGSYKIRVNKMNLDVTVKQGDKEAQCEFDLGSALLIGGETE